ncbi:Retrotransposon-derived protein peg10 [Entomophthora muscae]|uniref:Retrotransposon-derived protein peg10 n=1 Tax=Entomophthora muscae TaxID=34485 RepID=A0ACC2SJC9_9FUNG|nr:Retrotransposon-derived protein peg10 [Entomophthora muscae]
MYQFADEEILKLYSSFCNPVQVLAGFCKVILQAVPTFLYLLNLNPNALHALVYSLVPLWARPYIILASHVIDPGNTFSISSIIFLALFLSIIIVFCNKQDHTPTTYTNQTVVLNTLAHSSPPPTYAQAHFTAYGSEFSTNSQKVLYLAEKLTGHYRDWFSSHSIRNPGILQNYNLFASSLLSFSGGDKELSTPSTSWFSGLTRGLLPLGKYNWKFFSLQSRLQASDAEACSFYKIGLKRLLQNLLSEKWLSETVKYLSSKTHPSSNLFPAAQLFVPDKVLLSSTPPPGTKPKSGGGFCLTAKEVLRRRNNNLCFYCGSKDHLLTACPLSKHPPFVNKTFTLTLLSLSNTSKSPTVLVTICGPLGTLRSLLFLILVLIPT